MSRTNRLMERPPSVCIRGVDNLVLFFVQEKLSKVIDIAGSGIHVRRGGTTGTSNLVSVPIRIPPMSFFGASRNDIGRQVTGEFTLPIQWSGRFEMNKDIGHVSTLEWEGSSMDD